MIFIDTNYFLRFLLADVSDQHIKAKELILSGSHGQKELFTSLLVMFEIYWVLSSFYKKDKQEISSALNDLLDLQFIDIESRDLLSSSLKTYSTSSLDLEDAYNLVYAKSHKAKSLATFDINLQKMF
ncbi:MAG: PIN domain-containing protein [Patescibacteria group bacterium]